MQCVNPISVRNPAIDDFIGWQIDLDGNYINPESGEVIPPRIKVPCGRCIVCQNNRREAWAARLELESRTAAVTYFITLTFNEDSVPEEIRVEDLQKFFKRLRKFHRLRYFACGEYGGRFGRPHYHAVVFLERFEDLPVFRNHVQTAWPYGFVQVSLATRERFAYVAKYTVKTILDLPPGVKAPFATMSRRPGIGSKYFSDIQVFRHDILLLEGGKTAPLPRYFLDKLPESEQVSIKRDRRNYAEAVEKSQKLSETDIMLRAINLERSLCRKYVRKYGK